MGSARDFKNLLMPGQTPDPSPWKLELDAEPSAAAQARRWTAALAAACGLAEPQQRALVLAVSEWVSLVLTSGPDQESPLRLSGQVAMGRVCVALSWAGPELTLEAADGSPFASLAAQRCYVITQAVDAWRVERQERWSTVVLEKCASSGIRESVASVWPPPLRQCAEGDASKSAVGHVLIVEDDGTLRELLTELLMEQGYRVSTVAHGKKALWLLGEGLLPDLILLDLMMPVMNGWEFLREKSQDPMLRSIPVIVLSGTTRTAEKVLSGVEAFLAKPCDSEHLLQTVSRCCRTAG